MAFRIIDSGIYPTSAGYKMPAEWAPHKATWLSWPKKEESWPGKLAAIYPSIGLFIAQISKGEIVNINIDNYATMQFAQGICIKAGADMSKVKFHFFETNDAWCRDHGPAYLINPAAENKKVIVDWGYNAWGNKYPPFDADDVIPTKIAQMQGLPVYHPGIIMEGGSVEFNGAGALLTSEACLLNENRNPTLSKVEIEGYLCNYYGVEQILWVGDGIEGDDTDGHIDDITRFVNYNTVITVTEDNTNDYNHLVLEENLDKLHEMRLINGEKLQIVKLPMPSPLEFEDQRVPASYANFYIANAAVIVPTFRDKNDNKALNIIQECFKDRPVVGIDSTDIIWGLGSFHCLSQQEPAV